MKTIETLENRIYDALLLFLLASCSSDDDDKDIAKLS